MAERAKTVENLSSLLDVLDTKIEEGGVGGQMNLGDVLEMIGRRAYGPLLLIVGLVSISPITVIPGSTWAFAALTLMLALQLALHRDRPWMPRQALELKFSEEALYGFIAKARPTARTIDKVLKPRLTFLADPPWVFVIALMCAAAALVTFPLGFIPFGPIIPGLAIVVFGLGLTARDGLLLALGAALTITAAAVPIMVFT